MKLVLGLEDIVIWWLGCQFLLAIVIKYNSCPCIMVNRSINYSHVYFGGAPLSLFVLGNFTFLKD